MYIKHACIHWVVREDKHPRLGSQKHYKRISLMHIQLVRDTFLNVIFIKFMRGGNGQYHNILI